MEQTPLPPLVSDAQITWRSMCAENGVIVEETSFNVGAYFVRDIYEKDRQRTREVVQAILAKWKLELQQDGWELSDGYDESCALAKSRLQIEPKP